MLIQVNYTSFSLPRYFISAPLVVLIALERLFLDPVLGST